MRLAYFQTHLPLIRDIEGVPELAGYYNGPTSDDIELLMCHSLPSKERDPGSMMLSVTFPNQQSIIGLVDTEASCNLMPYAKFERLKPGEFLPLRAKLEFADKSSKKARGQLKNVIVRIEELIIPTDFTVVEQEQQRDDEEEPYLLLGRPFMTTTRMRIDMRAETLEMTVLGKTLLWEIFNDNAPPVYLAKDPNYCFDNEGIAHTIDGLKSIDRKSLLINTKIPKYC